MDIQLARTFLEIISSGSFLAAAERLHVTQSAVSLRIKRLEDSLGRQLFERVKSGVILTPAGRQFERHARTFLHVWEEARYQINIPDGLRQSLVIGSQTSLWPRIGFDWLAMMEVEMPNVALHAHMGVPDRLARMMQVGSLDISILYTTEVRPGLKVQKILDDSLVLVSTNPEYTGELDRRYIYIDWGPEFASQHRMQHQSFNGARTSLSLGSPAISYVISNHRAAYFPESAVRKHIRDGTLHAVPDVPVMPFPAYVVWNESKATKMIDQALLCLDVVVAELAQ